MPDHFYGAGLPGVRPENLPGLLVVLEGADGSGRSTQLRLLRDWLEGQGHAVVEVGLRRSSLVARELSAAKEGHILGHTTMSLFYATDFADQLEHVMIPALRAGNIVLADRYIYTLMARDVVRGANPGWVERIYGMALVPDAVFYLKVSPRVLVERSLEKNGTLDYWESGMDLGLARDMYDSFLKYQSLMQNEFARLQQRYGFETLNGNRSIRAISVDLRSRIERALGQKLGVGEQFAGTEVKSHG
ncbi:MAG TPA: thymidylate kinase [Chloroflexota bacterium]|nr:thymidylate kinase [Chloroflexota bacterium]